MALRQAASIAGELPWWLWMLAGVAFLYALGSVMVLADKVVF